MQVGIIAFLFLFFIFIFIPINTHAHVTSEYDTLPLALSPQSDFKENRVGFFQITEDIQYINITQINNSFVFDPILVNLQIYNNTPNFTNESHFVELKFRIDRSTLVSQLFHQMIS